MVSSTLRLDVNNISARSLAKSMWSNNVITALDLCSNGLDDHAGSYIARMLKRNSTLKKLELDYNELGPKTCVAFSETLIVNRTLRVLSLDSNPLTSGGGDFNGFRLFAGALLENRTLTSLNLHRCVLLRTNTVLEGAPFWAGAGFKRRAAQLLLKLWKQTKRFCCSTSVTTVWKRRMSGGCSSACNRTCGGAWQYRGIRASH
jgi:hypothetical protein